MATGRGAGGREVYEDIQHPDRIDAGQVRHTRCGILGRAPFED